MRYLSLDGLRGLAAVTVVISHFSNTTAFLGGALGWGAGQLGVMLFFCLSGFLMGRLYLDQPFNTEAVARFATKRVARVFPLYLVVVSLSFAVWSATGSPWPLYPVNSDNLISHLLFWRGESVLWTIPVEVQFYLVFPLIWFACQRLGSVVLAFLLALVALVAALQFPDWVALVRYLPFFVAGLVVAKIPAPKANVGAMDLLFVVGLVLYVFSFPRILEAAGVVLEIKNVWKSPAYLMIVPFFLWAALHSSLAERMLGSATGRFLGDISYSIYLLHYPILQICMAVPFLGDGWRLLPFYVVSMLVACSAAFYLFEKPARLLLSRPASSARLLPS